MKLVDIGAFNGDSALHFISYPDIDSIDAYEPNTLFKPIWDAIEDFYPITFTPKAVYIRNGEITFYKRPDALPLGSTIMQDKIQDAPNEQVTVECIDILDVVPDEPYCLKLDAEGAEYDILERIIEADKAHFINRLYVEWHGHKMTGDYSARQEALMKHFKNRIQHWL